MDNNQNPQDEAALKKRIAELEQELKRKQLSIDYKTKLIEAANNHYNTDLIATFHEEALKKEKEEQKKK